MCGIAGRYNFLTGAPVDAAVIRRMARMLSHRGPDGEGVHTDGPIGLGHRRLAVIDLSPAAAQPMSTPDGRLTIVFNGEVYNFLDLRDDLERRGHSFRTRSDTEVVLAAYREFGVDFLARLRGMFAFALWDAALRRLIIARDRLGKKPLHYRLDADGISFASEPKAFLVEPGFQPRPNPEAISYYLTYQYVPAPLSAFEGLRKLPPASYLLVEGQNVSVTRYWRLRYAEKRVLTDEEACEQLLEHLRESIRLRLVSDVPVGAFLSGGIDSGTVVALMSELGGRVKTFSIGFDEKDYDELPYARMVAERYGTDHHEFIVRPDIKELLPRLVWHYNEPYADSSAIPTFQLAEVTRRHVTVALNGDGGDENFAGYDRYVANQVTRPLEWMPMPLRKGLELASRAMPLASRRSRRARLRRLLEAASETRQQRYVRWMAHFHPSEKTWLCSPDFLARAGHVDTAALLVEQYAATDATDFVDATLDVDVNRYLPDDLLVKVDIACMAHGLEGRAPFLDHAFMEFAAGLPSNMKLRGTTKKYILKRAVARLLPADIIERPKMGFGVPIDHWFRNELKELAYDTLLGRRMLERGYFRRESIEQLLDDHVRFGRNRHYQLWNLLMLELWHQAFIDTGPQGASLRAETP